MWVSQYPKGHGTEAADDRGSGSRVRVADEGVDIEGREPGEYFQLLGRVAKSIVGQRRGGDCAGHLELGKSVWFV